jgi:hypothetical protein
VNADIEKARAADLIVKQIKSLLVNYKLRENIDIDKSGS